jgi:hypothetical protein
MIQEENFQIWLYTRYESLKKKKRILIGYLLNLLYKKGIIDSHNIYSGFSPETYEEVTKGKKNPPHHHPLVNIQGGMYQKQRALPIIKS